eukprot:maker-scaffold_13-snap-gene-0.44-mRNA-1 protein AED:0.00 eAED:0.00 QI:65/1/1/1/1/1/2/79/426
MQTTRRAFSSSTSFFQTHSKAQTRNFTFSSGNLFAWGTGDEGQLAQANVEKTGFFSSNFVKSSPIQITEFPRNTKITQASAGNTHAAALSSEGDIFTWGSAEHGKLGHTSVTNKSGNTELCLLPHKITSPAKFKAISANDFQTAALSTFGELYTCGWAGSAWSGSGALGVDYNHVPDGSISFLQKVSVGGDLDVRLKAIDSGKQHMLGLGIGGEVYSWGKGEYGRLGNGGNKEQPVPLPIDYFLELDIEVEKIACGSNFNLALDVNGVVYAWGSNDQSQLGLGQGFSVDMFSMENLPRPVEFNFEGSDSKRIIEIAAGEHHSIAITDAGEVYSWGMKLWMEPHLMTTLKEEHCVRASAGNGYSIVVTDLGRLYSWGRGMGVGKSGVLGLGHSKRTVQPELIPESKKQQFQHVSCGSKFALGLTGQP